MLSNEDIPVLRRLLSNLLEYVEQEKNGYLVHSGDMVGRFVRDGEDVSAELLQREADARKMIRKLDVKRSLGGLIG